MALPHITMGFREQRRHALQPFVAKLAHLPATCTDQMLVVRGVACRLVAAKSLAEVARHDETTRNQQLERTVHRRCAGPQVPDAELSRNLFGRKVPGGLRQHVRDRQPLCGYRQVVLAEVGAERLGHD